MNITVLGLYQDFSSLGQGVLQMLGDIHHADVARANLQDLKNRAC
jgi:hypothetical protein